MSIFNAMIERTRDAMLCKERLPCRFMQREMSASATRRPAPASRSLVMLDDTPAYPYAVSMEIVHLAPHAEVTLYPWKEPKDLIPRAVHHVRDFFRTHQPVTSAR